MSKVNHSIQEKMTKLDELLAWFDGEDFELEAAVEKFKEAKKLADEIEQDLIEVKNTITVVAEQFDQDKE
jgi:exodeoxyribonuclease VII small subunit